VSSDLDTRLISQVYTFYTARSDLI